jgi:hypothetical protein
MKFTTIALAIAFTVPSTFALARSGMSIGSHVTRDGFRGNHFGGGFGAALGDGYGGRDVWGHRGTYYGPMVPTPF